MRLALGINSQRFFHFLSYLFILLSKRCGPFVYSRTQRKPGKGFHRASLSTSDHHIFLPQICQMKYWILMEANQLQAFSTFICFSNFHEHTLNLLRSDHAPGLTTKLPSALFFSCCFFINLNANCQCFGSRSKIHIKRSKTSASSCVLGSTIGVFTGSNWAAPHWFSLRSEAVLSSGE